MRKRNLLIGAVSTFMIGSMVAIPNVLATENIDSWSDLQTCIQDPSQEICAISSSGLDASSEANLITINREVTIDLNDATLTTPQNAYGFEIAAGADVTIQNGILDGSKIDTTPKATIKMTGGTGDQTSKLTVATNAVIKGTCVIKIQNTVNNEGIILDVQGELHSVADNAGKGTWPIYVDGNLQSVTTLPKITISGLISNEVGGTAFYQGGLADTTITGTLKGGTGASIKAGTVNFNNATVIANGPKVAPETNTNGSTSTGAAIQVSSVGNYARPINVSINGGSYTSENANAIEVFGDEAAESDSHIAAITLSGNVKLSAPKGKVLSNSLSSFEGIKSTEGEVIDFGDTTVWSTIPEPTVSNQENNSNTNNPQTSDNIISYIAISIISIIGIACLTIKKVLLNKN